MTDEINAKQLQEEISIEQKAETKNNKYLIIGIVAGILILAAVVVATIFLVRADKEVTAQIRDIFIIFMALASLVLGIALVVLITQLAILINLLQNEIRPILDSTTETVNTLKGTTQFLSNNLTEPVIKLNEYLAMFKRIIKPSKK
jgi:nitrate reductase gamma subunit